MPQKSDFLIIGAGIVGLSIAEELRRRHPKATITILEKESGVGKHASGRNSGVLHSGVFYAEDSIKAKLCAQGAKEMGEYCQEHHLPIQKTGKVIIPTHEEDDKRLDVLCERAKSNGATATLIDEQTLREVEPDVRSISGRALHLPDVNLVDPFIIVGHLSQSLKADGVILLFNHHVEEINAKEHSLTASGTTFIFEHLFNAAGLYADKIATAYDPNYSKYMILPFKGIYFRVSDEAKVRVKGLVYAVPDPKVPFLGIHYMRKMDGIMYLGPTVVPALSRENYHGLQNVKISEFMTIFGKLADLYRLNHQGFRMFVHREAPRFFKRYFYEAAKMMTPNLLLEDLVPCEKVGIRAQLLDREKQELVMDFLVAHSSNATHILNAVSPAFTSAFPFARLVLDEGHL